MKVLLAKDSSEAFVLLVCFHAFYLQDQKK